MEEFDADLGIWDRSLYEHHWLAAARRIVEDGRSSTAFFTTTFQSFWPMWRRGDHLHVQERLLIRATLIVPFDPADLYSQIGLYRRYSEPGVPLSEWRMKVGDLNAFIRRRGKKLRAG